MLFQTVEFTVLLSATIVGLLMLRGARHQQIMLLIASYVFYGWWDVRFVFLLLFSSVVDYTASLGVEGHKLSVKRQATLGGLVVAGVYLFLGLNWPAVQSETSVALTLQTFFQPQWAGVKAAIVAALVITAVLGVLYQWFFTLGDRSRRIAFLTTSVVINLGTLSLFKYFNFFLDSASGVGSLLGVSWQPPMLNILLPVGVSFYTFQTMSYTIDVFRGLVQAERSILRVLLYVAYFPQLVAGPILRPSQFMPSLESRWALKSENIYSGFHLIMVGLVKKVLVADWVALLVDQVFSESTGMSSLVVMLGAALFAIQIYCDFSGYTDIARGISRLFGIEIPLNFNFPYFSTSIIDFWRRWHISLSTWLRDYLYIPLGGSRCRVQRVYANLMITMLLGGLWHGAAWNFVVWGGYQGVLLCINRALLHFIERRAKLQTLIGSRLGRILCWAVTMYLTLLGWLIFRANSTEQLIYMMKKFLLFDGRLGLTSIGLGIGMPFHALAATAFFIIMHATGFFTTRWPDRMDRMVYWQRVILYFFIGMLLLVFWPPSNQPFVYFQF